MKLGCPQQLRFLLNTRRKSYCKKGKKLRYICASNLGISCEKVTRAYSVSKGVERLNICIRGPRVLNSQDFRFAIIVGIFEIDSGEAVADRRHDLRLRQREAPGTPGEALRRRGADQRSSAIGVVADR